MSFFWVLVFDVYVFVYGLSYFVRGGAGIGEFLGFCSFICSFF